ncbi:hypothetical protein V6N11_066153 [Hibiscus sabdariffa]|uniref:GRF-type domain-containing protein n=1 Tax=Hibiscus sabdariffa TaxID=183260 RepID=A0ABR2AI18_9ROSI
METGVPICHCGHESKIVTSWTDENPGRRFFGCKNYGRGSHCRFFAWYDAPLTPRARVRYWTLDLASISHLLVEEQVVLFLLEVFPFEVQEVVVAAAVVVAAEVV